VLDAVCALQGAGDLVDHLARQCWAVGTDSEADLCAAFHWDPAEHELRVARAEPGCSFVA
jgi:hypothetical protein